jgi:hypothetical protein
MCVSAWGNDFTKIRYGVSNVGPVSNSPIVPLGLHCLEVRYMPGTYLGSHLTVKTVESCCTPKFHSSQIR